MDTVLFLTKEYRLLKISYQDELLEAGCDEAGRGCFAGPVFAAAVILPTDFFHPLLNDSKQLTAEERYALRPVIEEKAMDYAVGIVNEEEIDMLNILWASVKAMHIAVSKLKKKNRIPVSNIQNYPKLSTSKSCSEELARSVSFLQFFRLEHEYTPMGW